VDSFFYYFSIFAVTYHIQIEILSIDFLSIFDSNCMFDIIVYKFSLVIVKHEQLVYSLIQISTYANKIFHFLRLSKNFVNQLLNNLRRDLFIYYFLLTLLILLYYSEFSQKFKEKLTALLYLPKLTTLIK
jgi:hypothetical protein